MTKIDLPTSNGLLGGLPTIPPLQNSINQFIEGPLACKSDQYLGGGTATGPASCSTLPKNFTRAAR